MGIFEKFKLGFKKSASTFTSGLKDIITKKEIDDKTLNKVEDYLIFSDVGVEAAADIPRAPMNDRLAKFSATVCAASSTSPSQPIITPANTKAQDSIDI